MLRLAAILVVGCTLAATGAVAGPRQPPADPKPVASPADDLVLLEAATWGASPSSWAELKRLGRERWLAAQLRPAPDVALPAALQSQIDALPGRGRPLVATLRELDEQNRAANALADPDARKAAQQAYQGALNDHARAAGSATILRALYAPDQLREKLAWFWLNHLNVFAGKANLRAMVGDYMDGAIRPHALGRFRDLVSASMRHPAMLRYLDNAENAAGRLNENYARELMELHTLGIGGGYAQADVEALARILTGLGIDLRPEPPKLRPELAAELVGDGAFLFNPARHDRGDKTLLGASIRGGGIEESERALDLLVRHPATARRVSRALATFLGGDDPPDALVGRVAATFTRTDGDIAETVRTLLAAPEFPALARRRFKMPVAFVFSALRLAYDTRPILNTAPVEGWLNRLGQGPFRHPTPDGSPLESAAWTGPGQMVTRFEIARAIGGGPAGLFKGDGVERPGFPLLQNELYFALLRERLGDKTRRALDEAVSPQDWNTLFLSSPEFMR